MKVHFISNPEHKLVVCQLTDCANDFEDFILMKDLPDTYERCLFGNTYKQYKMPNKFVGRAVCGPDDVFDEKIGREIAFSRAKANYDRSFFKRAQRYVNHLDDKVDRIIGTINHEGKRMQDAHDYRQNKINYMLGVTNGNS